MADDLNRATEGGNMVGDETIPATMPIREEPGDNEKLIEFVESTFDLFYPRYHWTTPQFGRVAKRSVPWLFSCAP